MEKKDKSKILKLITHGKAFLNTAANYKDHIAALLMDE
jgi:hypothetical protein